MKLPEVLNRCNGKSTEEFHYTVMRLVGAPRDTWTWPNAHINDITFGKVIKSDKAEFICRVVNRLGEVNTIRYNRREAQRHGLNAGDTFIRVVARYNSQYPVYWRKVND